ncbi:MAG TPA: malic enzyme-like NAD(P)-binding protein, partial [Ilumatobacteraceae bacterium]|nr:malic enzyme-like NAD(P)-binding protein [Ilumatobacteraceae bacterium]
SPFAPVEIADRTVPIAQVNNVYVFPGVGLGVVAVKARAVSDEMLTAAATEIGRLAAENADGGILPPVTESREVARHVAFAVARTAVHQALATPMTDDEISTSIDEASWFPVYRELRG